MRKTIFGGIIVGFLLFTYPFSALSFQEDVRKHPSCPFCGMDRQHYAHSRMLILYDDETTVGTCSLHCTASEMAVNRQKTMKTIDVADHVTKELIDAQKATWVIGGNKMGVMTKRAKWAFKEKEDAGNFIQENGGALATFDAAIKATFEDMYDDIRMIRENRRLARLRMVDLKHYPECKYCGMMREKYAYSRMLIEFGSDLTAGTCSIHCASIDLALNIDKIPKAIMAGDYDTKKLIDAERAFWIVGGNRMGVMSIRGKWAFEEKGGAEKFIKENGGHQATFEEAMKAAFEDMHEILR